MMVESQIVKRGVRDPRVLAAMRAVPRRLFVPPDLAAEAYRDSPLPIGYQQTISQPYVVAHMSEMLEVDESLKVLEIGTGSGYQAAILSKLAGRVCSIEIVEPLARSANERLARLGYDNVEVRLGDGYLGWPEQAPFDRIILTAAPERLPEALVEQLAPGGRLVAPVGPQGGDQRLLTVEKDREGRVIRKVGSAVLFVPMVPSEKRER